MNQSLMFAFIAGMVGAQYTIAGVSGSTVPPGKTQVLTTDGTNWFTL